MYAFRHVERRVERAHRLRDLGTFVFWLVRTVALGSRLGFYHIVFYSSQ